MAAENCFALQQQQNMTADRQTGLPFETGAMKRLSEDEYQMWYSRCVLDISSYKQKSNRGFVLVDVRAKSAYQNGHVPDSLNIPVYEIKTKSYLKNKPLLLINEGHDRKSLVLACMQLRERGFRKAFVLKDGLLAWEQTFGPVRKITRHTPYNLIPAKNLFYERDTRNWLVVDMSGRENSRIQRYFTHILKTGNIANIGKFKKQLMQRKMPVADYSIVVVDRDGRNLKGFERLYDAFDKTDMYYLQGGVEQFDKFVNTQYAMLSKREFVLQKPKSCSR